MPKRQSDTPPLSLSQVLEDEYVKLHNATRPTCPDGASEDERLSAIYKHIHALEPKRSALCISGGGIRSATFALGIIQGLARCGVLDKFDYLSTVSGGGYVGGWLTAWMHRHGRDWVIAELAGQESEPTPVSRLRDYSNYLNPKLGLLSADSWTLVATVVRNVLLSWMVLIPLFAAVLIFPRALIPVIKISASEPMQRGCLIVGCLCLVWAVGYIGLHRPSVNLLRGDQGGYLKWCLLPLTLASMLLITYWAWAGHKLVWSNSFQLSLGAKAIEIREDLLIFALLGIAINFIAFLGGAVVRFRHIRLSTLLQTPAIVFTGALGGSLVWCGATLLFPEPLKTHTTLLLYVCFSSPAFLTALLLAESVFVGFTSYFTNDSDREWWARSEAWILIYIVVWSASSSLVIFGPMAMMRFGGEARTVAVSFLSGFFTLLVGRISTLSSQTAAEQKTHQQENGDWKSPVLNYALWISSAVFAVSLTLLIALAAEIVFHRSVPNGWQGYRDGLLATTLGNFSVFVVALAAVGFTMGLFVNINKFSLHGTYRNRLIRAYLGASRESRHPNLFTGWDENDNILMNALWPNNQPPHGNSPRQPFHVINMALNLVGGQQLAWQQRTTESFTVSPLHAGCYRENVGYRRTEYNAGGERVCYGGREGITLGTAMAISGIAEKKPQSTYHWLAVTLSRRGLFRAFNTRVGWWLGNPGPAGERTFRLAGPLLAAKPMIDEALGLTDDVNQYVYLSDGGHFENLGLYEMVLRRCHTIVVSDAAQDGYFRFEDLGGAVRKIRIDFGIPITFEQGIKIYSREQKRKGYYCAIGTIGYSRVDGEGTDGVLIYIKPTFYGTEPADVYQSAQSNKAFPHDPTADQWFDEAQFESYRMLGSHVIGLICGHADKKDAPKKSARDTSLNEFVEMVREYLERPQAEQLDDRDKPAPEHTS